MTKRIDPLLATFATFEAMRDQVIGRLVPGREDALREETEHFIVDTVAAFDTGEWETGIERPGQGWTIVEQYEDRNAAEVGHAKWVKAMQADPAQSLNDIDLWGLTGA